MKKIFICRILLLFILITSAIDGYSKKNNRHSKVHEKKDSVTQSLDFLKYYFHNNRGWKLANPNLEPTFKGLLSYIETPPRDTIVSRVDSLINSQSLSFFTRDPETIENFELVPNYIDTRELQDILISRDREIRDSLQNYRFHVPDSIYAGVDSISGLIASGDEENIKAIPNFKLPKYLTLSQDDSIKFKENNDFWQRHDSLYFSYLKQEREKYNSNLKQNYRDSLWNNYQTKQLNSYSDSVLNTVRLSVEQQNKEQIISYNDSVINCVNDSLYHTLKVLNNYAANDSVLISLENANNTLTHIWLKNDTVRQTRLHVQNPQNDSVNVIIENKDSRSLRLLIDDAVVFQRFKERDRISAQKLQTLIKSSLYKVEDVKVKFSPWKLGVNSSVGFTQTYITNWAKGGQSALSTLSEIRGYANYSENKTKWESYLRLKHGLISHFEDKATGKQEMSLKKNSDLLELSSRFGKSAFKKWYYSTELNLKTQMFNGYNYPNDSVPISAFMAPGYLTFAIGLDYKPHKDFSLFLSPITSKTTFVLDTAKVDPTKYGLDADKKSLWEPGFISKLSYKKKIMDQVNWDTKASLFINYTNPIRKFDFDWESRLTFKVNQFIDAKISTHLIYDDDVKFPVYEMVDGVRKQTGKEAKWQFKELFVIGFNYSIKY